MIICSYSYSSIDRFAKMWINWRFWNRFDSLQLPSCVHEYSLNFPINVEKRGKSEKIPWWTNADWYTTEKDTETAIEPHFNWSNKLSINSLNVFSAPIQYSTHWRFIKKWNWKFYNCWYYSMMKLSTCSDTTTSKYQSCANYKYCLMMSLK